MGEQTGIFFGLGEETRNHFCHIWSDSQAQIQATLRRSTVDGLSSLKQKIHNLCNPLRRPLLHLDWETVHHNSTSLVTNRGCRHQQLKPCHSQDSRPRWLLLPLIQRHLHSWLAQLPLLLSGCCQALVHNLHNHVNFLDHLDQHWELQTWIRTRPDLLQPRTILRSQLIKSNTTFSSQTSWPGAA